MSVPRARLLRLAAYATLVGPLLGTAAGWLWVRLVLISPPKVERTADSVILVDYEHQFSDEGWFTVVGAVGGLLIGLVFVGWALRSRVDPVKTLVLALVVSAVAARFCAWGGGWFGPVDPVPLLQGAGGDAVGTTLPGVIRLSTWSPQLVWPLLTALGSWLLLLGAVDRGEGAEPVEGDGHDSVSMMQ